MLKIIAMKSIKIIDEISKQKYNNVENNLNAFCTKRIKYKIKAFQTISFVTD